MVKHADLFRCSELQMVTATALQLLQACTPSKSAGNKCGAAATFLRELVD